LPNLEVAYTYAISMARFEVSQAAVRNGRIMPSHHIDIEDENGTLLATVYFRDAFKIEEGREAADELPNQGSWSRSSAPNRIDDEQRRA
jgi:hypothetical protein